MGIGSPALAGLRKAYSFVACQLLAVLLMFLGLEGATRLLLEPVEPIEITAATLLPENSREPFFRQHPFAAHTWIPNARFGAQVVNTDGFVSTREVPLEKAPNELRVVTLGGSSTVGNLNRDEETYPRVLEKLLREWHGEREVSVINAAAGGYTTMDSLGYFQRRMVYYRPDVVLIMHAWNDMYYFTLSDRRLSARRTYLYDKAVWTPWNVKRDPLPPVVRLMRWSQFYLHLRNWLESHQFFRADGPAVVELPAPEIASEPGGKRRAINPAAIETYRTNLLQIRALCDIRSIDCYSILQPTLLSTRADRRLAKVRRAREIALVHGFDADRHVAVFEQLYAVNRAVFGEEHCIDATSLSGDASLFHDHIHMNTRGTRRLAEIVARELLRRSDHGG